MNIRASILAGIIACSAPLVLPACGSAHPQQSTTSAFASGTPAIATTPTPHVTQGTPVLGAAAYGRPSAVGWGTYAPIEIFNGGDPTGMVQDITWTGWGTANAYGYGKTSIAQPGGGYYRELGVAELHASDLGHCTSSGPDAYQQLDVREPTVPGGAMGTWSLWGGSTSLCHSS